MSEHENAGRLLEARHIAEMQERDAMTPQPPRDECDERVIAAQASEHRIGYDAGYRAGAEAGSGAEGMLRDYYRFARHTDACSAGLTPQSECDCGLAEMDEKARPLLAASPAAGEPGDYCATCQHGKSAHYFGDRLGPDGQMHTWCQLECDCTDYAHPPPEDPESAYADRPSYRALLDSLPTHGIPEEWLKRGTSQRSTIASNLYSALDQRGFQIVFAAPESSGLDVPATKVLVRALYASGLTDDMNPVERRKAALRLRDAMQAAYASEGAL